MELSKEQIQDIIARRVAQEFHNNDVVTLGIGLPTKAVKYLPQVRAVSMESDDKRRCFRFVVITRQIFEILLFRIVKRPKNAKRRLDGRSICFR